LFVGCLKGFSNFSLYARGREELLVTIPLDPATASSPSTRRDGVISPILSSGGESENDTEQFQNPDEVVFF